MNNHIAKPLQSALNAFAPVETTRPLLEAVAMCDTDGSGMWFVRLYHHNDPVKPEFCGLCEAEGEHEARLVALCINTAISHNAGCAKQVQSMFDWTRFNV